MHCCTHRVRDYQDDLNMHSATAAQLETLRLFKFPTGALKFHDG
ncbi:hypothetical protein [ANMV-1 virus]|nr:hypothetical protein [ANMV-1 virus]